MFAVSVNKYCSMTQHRPVNGFKVYQVLEVTVSKPPIFSNILKFKCL